MATLGVPARRRHLGPSSPSSTSWRLSCSTSWSVVGIVLTPDGDAHPGRVLQGPLAGRQAGRPRLSLWDDLALNRLFLVVVCAIVLVTATIVWTGSRTRGSDPPAPIQASFPLAIANGVLVVAYFGLALQFFLLRFGRRGAGLLALFLFLAWVVPLILGSITLVA